MKVQAGCSRADQNYHLPINKHRRCPQVNQVPGKKLPRAISKKYAPEAEATRTASAATNAMVRAMVMAAAGYKMRPKLACSDKAAINMQASVHQLNVDAAALRLAALR
jgi:hypothetical protein